MDEVKKLNDKELIDEWFSHKLLEDGGQFSTRDVLWANLTEAQILNRKLMTVEEMDNKRIDYWKEQGVDLVERIESMNRDHEAMVKTLENEDE